MPNAAGGDRRAKFSRIDSAFMGITQTGCKGIGDSQCNQNKEEYERQEHVLQNHKGVYTGAQQYML